MRKAVVAVVLLAVLFGGGYGVWYRFLRQQEEQKTEWTPVTVWRGPLRVTVQSTGRIVPNLEVEIKCKASGEVTLLPFNVSDPVRQGDVLVELDQRDEQRRVHQEQVSLAGSEAKLAQARLNLRIAERTLAADRKRAESALASAQAKAADAQAKAERTRQLFAKKLASQEEVDTTETAAVQARADLEAAQIRIEELDIQAHQLDLRREDIKLAEAAVEANRISLELARQRLEDTRVMAPIDGVISERPVQIGQIISSGINNVGGGTTIMKIADLSRVFVLASVDESDVGRVATGQDVEVTADAYPEAQFSGRVTRIATKGVNVSNVVTFEVQIEVDSANKTLLKPEMTANVEIVASSRDHVLLAPADAIFRRRDAFYTTVIGPSGATEERRLQVGLSDGLATEILAGLVLGETVAAYHVQTDSRWQNPTFTRGAMSSSRSMRMMMGGGGRRGL